MGRAPQGLAAMRLAVAASALVASALSSRLGTVPGAAAVGEGDELEPPVVLVDDVDECRRAVEKLRAEPEVAVDLEGVDLGRSPGRISIIQVCAADGTTYLFDITTLQQDAFDDGGLRDFFADSAVQKVFFDLRCDVDALHHNHDVSTVNAYDLQVLYQTVLWPIVPRLLGLKDALALYMKASKKSQETTEIREIKSAGQRLFAPELGGNYEVWETRPLDELLVKYAVIDVRHLLGMKRLFGGEGVDRDIVDSSRARIEKEVNGPWIVKSRSSRSTVDFQIPDGVEQRLPEGLELVEVPIVHGTEGLVIGYRGKTIHGIESSSGATVCLGDRPYSKVAVVVGKAAEVKDAAQRVRRAMLYGV